MSKEAKKPIETLLAELEKRYGLSKVSIEEVKTVSTGSYTLNKATGINGYPLGKIVEIYGQESSGKSTMMLHAISEYQKAYPEKKCALIDYEYSFDPRYAASIGVDVENLLIYQPDDQESGYDMIIGLATESICSLIVIDSHTAAIPKKIIEGEMGDATMALQARNNSKFLGKIKAVIDRTGTTLIAVSQTRTNIGAMGGDVNIPTGGNSWKFYSDMRFKVWKSPKKDDHLNATTIEIVKNKCAVPFGKAEFNIVWGVGIDVVQEIIDLALELNIIKKAGSWYSYGEVKLGQGTNGVKVTFDDNPEMYDEIKNKVLANDQDN